MILSLVSFLLLFCYSLLFVVLRRYWSTAPDEPIQTGFVPLIPVTVLVPFRNEEGVIGKTMDSLMKQDYPKDLLSIIAIDDDSSDNGVRELETFFEKKFSLTVIPNNSWPGKKGAIKTGVEFSSNDLIVTIDADVIVYPSWIKSIVQHFTLYQSDLIILPVIFENGNRFFSRLQFHEFVSLSGTTAATALAGHPVMCNGANLAFRKKAFVLSDSEGSPTEISSGDDMFLLFSLKKKSALITYLKNIHATGHTLPNSSLMTFIAQRTRWASKVVAYTDRESLVLGILTWLMNFCIFIVLFIAIFDPAYWWLLLTVVAIKSVIDFFFLVPFIRWFNSSPSVLIHLILSLVYPVYACLIPLIGLFYRPKWKGRTISLSRKQ
ncbi:MAG: glycosyltransferase [Crocinitomicaceae bacterium]|nr:glycosyltransferase [Crocinitomicaceae bacterium]